ncbi:CD36 family-domain-containing protein [Ochromonadaceae sp. CCMP2298]|nr:CD36 family-domain-containing protein [Ochromonadaceae sp. CCMP2298]|mmetsp:Transcript_7690/g.16807  ORF Transcript_7690/g.16807 Transcript_7690/m.16807 type:complete len:777 (-) Transcript_7690:305-2635(-)
MSGSNNSSKSGLSAEDMLLNSEGEGHSVTGLDPSAALNDESIRSSECFYKLCTKTKTGPVTCGRFKNRRHALYCGLFSMMMFCLFVAVIGPILLYRLGDYFIDDQVVIDNEQAPNYDAWQNNVESPGADHVVIHYDLYFFDVQNVAEVLTGQRPKLVQRGPYAFQEYYVKFDISWSDGGDTVTYNAQKYYLWDDSRMGAGLSREDDLMLPYATVIGFEYLLGSIPLSADVLLDALVDDKLKAVETQIEAELSSLYAQIDDDRIPKNIKAKLEAKMVATNESVQAFFGSLYSFVGEAKPGDLLLKTLMCKAPSGLSPFRAVKPYEAWFGWLNDPILVEVQGLLNVVAAKTGKALPPWNTAVPGGSTNWSSIEETRRRRAPDTFKTGLDNINQVGQYVHYEGMDQMWACVAPMDSQDPSQYMQGEQFPACEFFDLTWTNEQAAAKGYVQPFRGDWANRVAGTDAMSFGRPVTTEKLAVFISDIYRSVFLEHVDDVDWAGVPLKRYTIQAKDLLNSTANPENTDYYNFAPSGMENTTLAAGLPVFVSFPHFLNGDPRLVAAVEGLNPQASIHESFLDIEPQTGLLAGAQKKLQLVYQMVDHLLPSTRPDSIQEANSICANMSDTLDLLHQFGVDTSPITDLSCNLTLATELLTCFNAPADWQMYDGGVFFPYAWADEHFYLPDSDAEDLSNGLFILDTAADQMRFWSLVASAVCGAALLAVAYNANRDKLGGWDTPAILKRNSRAARSGSLSRDISQYEEEDARAHDLLLERASEPLLS